MSEKLSRRDFLRTSLTTGGAALAAAAIPFSGAVAETVGLNHKAESIRLSGGDEVDFFMQYFGISPDDEIGFFIGVHTFQNNHGLSGDGILGPNTLRALYTGEYFHNWERLGRLQQWRLQSYFDISHNYPSWRRYVKKFDRTVTLRVRSNPDVMNKNYYFGDTEGAPLNGGFINSSLVERVSRTDNSQGVKGYLRKIGERYIVTLYVDGQLELASYCSPGNSETYGEGAITPQLQESHMWNNSNEPGTLTAKMHYISGGDDSVSNTRNQDGSYYSDYMPYACAVSPDNGIYTHAGAVNGLPRSHGCMRLPCHYAMGVYRIFEQHGEIDWDTRWSNSIA